MRDRCGHLAAAGVVLADEQHLGQLLCDKSVDLGGGSQLIAREPLDQRREERRQQRRLPGQALP